MLLERDKSQLLIIDMQEKLLPAVSGDDDVVKACRFLIRCARDLGVPITVSEQYPKGLGSTVEPLREELGNAGTILPKTQFSCVKNPDIRAVLDEARKDGRPQVVIGGIEAHVCVAQTAIDLEQHGFEAFVAADAISSRSKANRKHALARLMNAGVDVIDTEAAMFEWIGDSTAPEFRELSKLIR